MQAQPGGGAMAAVFADEARVAAALAPYRGEASIAAVNGSEQVVISGVAAAVQGVVSALAAEGVRAQRLTVSHAFHSPLMEPVLEPFRRVAQAVPCAAARVPLVSNLDGRLLAEGQLLDAAYWVRHVREPVAFAAGVRTLADQGCRLWLEIGPGPVLLGLARRCLDPNVDAVWLPSLRPGQDDWRPLLDSLSALYVEGVAVDWAGFDRDYPRRRLALPTYPFERQRYWLPPVANGRPAARGAGPTQPGSPHELLGRRLASPLKETLFEARLGPRTPPYLGDHRILGTAVLPLAGFLEMALAAARHVFGEGPCRVEDVVAEEWLLLPEEQEQTVQMIVSPQGPGQASFQVFRQAAEDGGKEAWRVHARGTIRTGAEAVEPEDLDAVRTRCPEELEIGQCYQEMRDRGLEYGPGFQGLVRIRRGAGEAIGQIQLPEPLVAGADACQFHPALLDACIHPIGKALPDLSTEPAAWIPVGLERLTVFGRPGTRVWCHARVRPEDPAHRNRRVGDLMIVDEAGQPVAHLAGLQVQQVGRDVLLRSTQLRKGDWLYHLGWQPRALTGPEWTLGDGPGNWLIFADRNGTGVELAELLEARGESCYVVFAGDPGLAPAARHGCIDPADRAAYARLLREGRREGEPPWRGVVHLWGLEDTPDEEDTAEALQAALPLKVGSALYLAQALAAAGSARPPRLWLVTRGTQRAEAGSDAGTLEGAPLWGLARVIALEQPELRCTCLDLDPVASRDEARTVYREVRAGDGEDQIAFRGGDRLVARLMRGLGGGDGGLQIPEGEAFQLETSQAGVLENLVLRPLSRRAPGPGEVEIRVRATGQNFRDVLCALGMYPGEMPPLGGECAGQVVRAGEGVRAFRPGDEVVAIAPGSFASHVTVDTRLVVARPPRLTPEEAATVPIAFLTAWYGLHTLARLGPGERVLIHAAAGGVGMAAVQLARRAGAEVFATASPSKWDAVKALGVEHVMNSRSLDFASEVMERTGGRGVDVVLNSLVGDYIPKSLGVLAPGGRFLEIGKREIWDRERVEHVKPGVAYIAYDLAELAGREPDRLQDLFRTLMEALQAGDLRPLPRRDYPIQDVGDAFRHMAQAKHVGKIVIVPPRDGTGLLEGAASVVRPDRTYLITGGVGALGLQVASWMVGQGARSLVLVGRRGSSPESAAALAQLREQGAQVVTAAADVARTEQVAGVLADAARSLPPLAGVVHAAGVLEDALLAQQDWERFARVLAPKVAGAWNLHCLTKDLPLDFFVLFSSAASLLGSPGQANYAAANAFLDALARHRRALHLPALSINWGPWAGAGMAAGRDGRDQGRRAAQGVGVIAPEQGLATLARLLGQPSPAQVAVLPIDWGTFLGQFPAGGLPPLLAELARTEQAGGQPAPPTAEQLRFLKDLAEAAPAQRRGLLLAHVREQVCKVLGLPPGQALDVHRGLMDLGMDSLMAVELRNRLQASLGQPLPATLMFENPTVAVLAESLLTEVLYPEAAPPPPVSSPPAKEAELDGLAEAEMAALLAEKLTALERDRT